MLTQQQLRIRVKALLVIVILGLVVSGVTAFPLLFEVELGARWLGIDPNVPYNQYSGLKLWIAKIFEGLRVTYEHYPFIAYGTDWLAFAHLVIAVFFIGPLIDPSRNVWVVEAGLIACLGVIPLALIAGWVREIPFYWRCIDSSFGVLGFIPLWICRGYIKQLESSY